MKRSRRHLFPALLLLSFVVVCAGTIGCPSSDKPAARNNVETNSVAASTNPDNTDQKPIDLKLDSLKLDEPVRPVKVERHVEPNEPEPVAKPTAPVAFADWPKPQVALFITGRQNGYIEPCGCTGLENAKGGLARRHSFRRQLEEKGWPVVALDVGNQIRRYAKQAEIKFSYALRGLKQMKYGAVAFGPDDLRIGLGLLNFTEEIYNPFVAANAVVFAEEIVPPYRVIEAGGQRIGVTAVLADDMQEKLDGITFQPAADGLAAAWQKLQQENCDLHVLLAHASLEESRRLAAAVPHFDVVVSAGGAGEPPWDFEKIPNTKTVMVQVGTKGMYVGVVGVFDNDKEPLRYEKITLDKSFPDSKEMLDLLQKYQQHLENQIVQLGWEQGLEIKPQQHPTGRSFVGSDACADCHANEYLIWKHGIDKKPGGEKGWHAIATHTLVEPPNSRSAIHRHFDPECLSCHVTGWNPQRYLPYKTGYLDLKNKRLHGNGCENCHGPASEHVALAEEDEEDPRVKQTIDRLSRKTARETCLKCHDLDNSPDFHKDGAFEEYWRLIAH